MACDQKAANLWVARFIPVVLVGIVGYATYVVVVLVCVDYLLRPRLDVTHNPRPSAAIVILLLYFLLLIPVAVSYFRLLQTVAVNPGYVPRGPQWYQAQDLEAKHRRRGKRRRSSAVSAEKPRQPWWNQDIERAQLSGLNYAHTIGVPGEGDTAALQHGLEQFCSRDVFVCEADGKPIFCSTCLNWKPDRAHHCREVGRCVRKMDHFCPWVGGIVSETNFKFFIQFVSYGSVYCSFVLVFMAIFVAEVKAESGRLSVQWVLILGFAALFGVFALGMAGGSIQLALINSTTVENLTRKTKIWQLAVRMPESYQPLPVVAPIEGIQTSSLRTVTYPLPQQLPVNTGPALATDTRISPDEPPPSAANPTPPRTFAILTSKPGDNPWDLGPLENFKQVMGMHWWDWLFPLKYSPCTNHESRESAFALGPVVERMRKLVGIPSTYQWRGEPHRGQRRKSITGSTVHRERSHRIQKSAGSEQRRLRREKKTRSRGQRRAHDETDVVR